jgi:hypothetical protein
MPFDVEAMNDLYQDVRGIEAADGAGYTKLEAIIYPETQAILNASIYPVKNLAPELQSSIRPGIAANYDAAMQGKVLDIIAGAKTDIQVVEKVNYWVWKETKNYLDYSIPEVYYTYIDNGEVRIRNYNDSFPVKDLLRTHYFAASMFRERTHGTCTSIATLKCAMLKAAGIPCRVIQTISPIYYHANQKAPYSNKLSRDWDRVYEKQTGDDQTWANHAFLEVYLGGQWVRVDQQLGIYNYDSHTLCLKIVSVADWSEVDFSETWPVDWIYNRPYYTLLLEDQVPRH